MIADIWEGLAALYGDGRKPAFRPSKTYLPARTDEIRKPPFSSDIAEYLLASLAGVERFPGFSACLAGCSSELTAAISISTRETG
jgi:hypothetical protein